MAIDRTQAPPAGSLHITPFTAVYQNTLSNGIPLYVVPFGREDLTEIQVIYSAGHSFEKMTGLTHVTARMMQEGNRSYDSLGFAEILDFYGASLEIESGYESTSFSLVSLTRHIDKTLELMQEMLYHPTFPEKEFQQYVQRGLQQLSVEEQKTGYIARKHFARHIFGKHHPYGKFTAREELMALEYNALKTCYHDSFHQGPAAIICSGRFDREALTDLLNHTFGKLSWTAPAQISQAKNSSFLTDTGFHFYPVKDTLQSTIRTGFPAISRNHADYYKLQMVSLILGGYFGSRLMKNIREEKGYTYGIGCSLTGLKYDGYFALGTDVAHEYVEPCIQEIKFEVNRMKEELVSFEELETARNYMFGVLLSRRETLFQIGEIVKNAWVNDLDLKDMNKVFTEIRDITPAEIQTFARRYFHPDQWVWVVAGLSGK